MKNHSRRQIAYWLVNAILVISLNLIVLMPTFAAAPYVPSDDNEVLETLPRELIAGRNELTTLRRNLASNPTDAELACQVAQRFMQLGNSEGDPRYYGYARAALHPWWELSDPPVEVLTLRAKLEEKDHNYDKALDDLKLLLKKQPKDAQAWINLANIYRTQGNYAQANEACDTLSEFGGELATVLCRAPIQAATGHAEAAYDSLVEILPFAEMSSPATVQWILTQQAEIAVVLGREELAEKHFQESLAKNPEDLYLIRSYAEFLLEHGREEEVLPLVNNLTGDNGILLWATIAARRAGQEKQADEWEAQLASSFEEIRLRGNEPHGRFEARYVLELQDDPQHALTIALANWQKQKEASDSRIVLQAAHAANDPKAAQPVLEFLKKSGTKNVMLKALVEELESK